METFIIPGEPKPWTVQMRRAERSKQFYNMVDYQVAIQAHVKKQWEDRDPMVGPIHLEMEFYRGTPANVTQDRDKRFAWQLRHIQMPPDRGNYLKAAEDALQGILFAKDAQVISDTAFKWYTDDPEGFTVIRIRPLADTRKLFGTRIGWVKVLNHR